MRRREQLLLLIAAAVLLAAVLAFAVYLPKSADVRQAKRDAQRKQAELARTAALVQSRPQLELRNRNAKDAVQTLYGRIPGGPQLPTLIVALEQAIDLSGVRLASLSFAQTQATGENAPQPTPPGVASFTMQVEVRGNYPQLRTFVETLETLPRAVIIDRIALSSTGDTVLANLTLRAFYLR